MEANLHPCRFSPRNDNDGDQEREIREMGQFIVRRIIHKDRGRRGERAALQNYGDRKGGGRVGTVVLEPPSTPQDLLHPHLENPPSAQVTLRGDAAQGPEGLGKALASRRGFIYSSLCMSIPVPAVQHGERY